VPSITYKIAAGLAACFTALFLSACSKPSEQAHSTHADDKPVISGEPAAFNNADVAFANDMTLHDEQGIRLSLLAPDHSTNSDLAAFAAKTGAALQVDADVLKALGAQWKDGGDHQPGGSAATTRPPIDNSTITRLDSLHGPEFDALWLESMINLDQGSIEMANGEIANGKNPDALGLAKQIVKARQDEIGQLQQMQQTR